MMESMESVEALEKRLAALTAAVPPPDAAAMAAERAHQARLAKPPGSLGRLEELAVQTAGILGRVPDTLGTPRLLVFAADNGVTAEGVASAPPSVTLRQTVNLARGRTGAAVLARRFGCRVTVCDVGIAAPVRDPAVLDRKIRYGTGNIAAGPAMTRQQALTALLAGADVAMTAEGGAVGVGEMGIGNTTTSAAVLLALLDTDAESVTGRGGGLTEAAFRRKREIVARAVAVNRPNRADPVDVLAKVGGLDLAAMCGAFLGTAASRRPAVLDGLISAAAALCAVRLCPGVRAYLVPGHASAEPGYRLAMDALALRPLLLLDMRLGEGSGCPLAFQILEAACAASREMATFEEAGIDDGYLDAVRREGT